MIQKIIRSFVLLLSIFFLSNPYSYGQGQFRKIWDSTFGGNKMEWLTCFQKTNDGGFILAGGSQSGISGDKSQANWDSIGQTHDYWIVKIDSVGNKLWDRNFGGTKRDELYSLEQTTDGGYLLGGRSKSGINGNKSEANWDTTENTDDFWIVKINSAGIKQWDKVYGGTKFDGLTSLKQTKDGGFILGGLSESEVSGNKTQPCQGYNDFWIVKIDSLGNKLWDKTFGGTLGDGIIALEITIDGGFILGGRSNSGIGGDKTQPLWGGNGDIDFWVVRTDSLGNKIWDKDFGGTEIESFDDIITTSDGSFVMGGISKSGISGDKTQPLWGGNGDFDYWILKVDSSGNKLWDKDFGGVLSEEDFGSVSHTSDGGYMFAGTSYSPISGNKTEYNVGQEQVWVVKTDSMGNIIWDKTIWNLGHDEEGLALQTTDKCFVIATYSSADSGGYKSEMCRGLEDYWIVELCDTTPLGINDQLSDAYFFVYPNPANNEIHVTSYEPIEEAEFIIYNFLGKNLTLPKFSFQKSQHQVSIKIPNLSPGVYTLEIILPTKSERLTFIKQ